MLVGGGDSTTRKDLFAVLADGRAKVESAPLDNDDVVRKIDLDTEISKVSENLIYVTDEDMNSLWN